MIPDNLDRIKERCENGVHVFRENATCQCAVQLSGPERAEGREGMVTVYDDLGRYLGCMGRETWDGMIRDALAALEADT